MSTFVGRLAQLACLSILVISAGHVDGASIDCTTLGSHMSLVALPGDDLPIATSTPAPSEPRNNSQLRHEGKIKREPVINDSELYTCFGNQARELSWLRNSIDNQTQRFRTIKNDNQFGLRWTQVAVIGFGALATILLAFGNSSRWSVVKSLAIVPTALVTAISTFSAFQDYRGEVTRTAKAESDLSKLITEIDIRLLEVSAISNNLPIIVDPDEVHGWWKRADGIIKGVDDDWLNHFSQSEAKK